MNRIGAMATLANFPTDAVSCFNALGTRLLDSPEAITLLEEGTAILMGGEHPKDCSAALSELADCDPYTADMAIALYAATPLREAYASRGLDDALFLGVLEDLRCKLMECRNVKGVWGTFVMHWYPGFYQMTRFVLGRLQYEYREMPVDMNGFTKGQQVLNCHIPSSGPLTDESVDDSLRRAYEFFGIKGTMAVICSSWMLYPPHNEELFPEGSNLRRFYDRFTVISERIFDEPRDAWRVFGTMDLDLQKLPTDTALRRNLHRYLSAGKKMGSGLGVLFYNPVNG